MLVSPREAATFTAIGGAAAVAANLVQVCLTIGFYNAASRLPKGTGVRPMGLAVVYFLVGLGALIVALPLSWAGYTTAKRNGALRLMKWARWCCFFSLTPYPFAIALLSTAASFAGVEMEP